MDSNSVASITQEIVSYIKKLEDRNVAALKEIETLKSILKDAEEEKKAFLDSVAKICSGFSSVPCAPHIPPPSTFRYKIDDNSKIVPDMFAAKKIEEPAEPPY